MLPKKENGVVIEPTRTPDRESFVPAEAVEESERQRRTPPKVAPFSGKPGRKSDPFSEERVDKNHEAMDSSDETLGG